MSDFQKAVPRRISSSGRRSSVIRDFAHTNHPELDQVTNKYCQGDLSLATGQTDKKHTLKGVNRGESSESTRHTNSESLHSHCVSWNGPTDRCVKQNFRAPLREKSQHDVLLMHTCAECLHFAELLSRENVPKHLIEASIRHKSFCAPSCTPQNIWEPWDDA